MRRTLAFVIYSSLFCGLSPTPAFGISPPNTAFRPDAKSVQWHGPAYRYPQAGWIVLHIEGEPYERGYQHGQLMAPELVRYVRCSASLHNPKAPPEGWINIRLLVNSLFLRRYDREYLEEMKGIADGASAAGARFGDRPLDLVDIVALNSWPEIETLSSANEATPTGLEGTHFSHAQGQPTPPLQPMHCSAFAATGPATADGKIVFGHITMFELYPSHFFNVWLDVKPSRGHRVLMQSYPGGIQSGLDYYLNDAGLLVCETTLGQTHFNVQGMSVASRIRQALQYSDTIDQVVDTLKAANNGLYTNEWLLADIKTNEIAMFELGTATSRLYRSSKKEWFGGTEGFYWGCNNTKDLAVRLETIAAMDGRPANVVWHPASRDRAWMKLYNKAKGKIDVEFGREAFTTPPVAAAISVDAKFTTTSLARDLQTWALFGPPLGRTWKPTDEERQQFPEIQPMASNPWTILNGNAPAKGDPESHVVDLPDRIIPKDKAKKEEKLPPTVAAWHGTLLPKTEADIWLAAAFSDYEGMVALENAFKEESDGHLAPEHRERLAVDLFGHRSDYLAGSRAGSDVPLMGTQSEITSNHWYQVAEGKGVLVLHQLRQVLGDPQFELAMDSFGRANAGKEVTAAQFQAHVEKASGKKLDSFFDFWLKQPGLPRLQLGKVRSIPQTEAPRVPVSSLKHIIGYEVEGEISGEGVVAGTQVEVTVETGKAEVTQTIVLDSPHASFKIVTQDAKPPIRVLVDKYGKMVKANGGIFSVLSFLSETENTLIVYGTADETASNREAAEELQDAIRRRWLNITIPVISDVEVSDSLLKTHHLLLVGRPDTNRVVDRFRATLPVTFGSRSFLVGTEYYAHPGSAVIAAGENPLDQRFSLVMVAGLSAQSTLSTATILLHKNQRPGEILVLPNGANPRTLVLPARDLVQELSK